MPKLTAAQVAGVCQDPPEGSTTAEWVAKARQESGFDTEVQDFLGLDHWGLFQISASHWNADYNENGRMTGSKENFRAMLKGANFNWQQAKWLYVKDREAGGSGWRPWAASGGKPTPTAADRAAAGEPDSSIGNSGGGDLGEAIPGLGPVNPLDDAWRALVKVADLIGQAALWISDRGNWARVAQVVVGTGLVVAAAAIIVKPYTPNIPSIPGV